MTQTEKRLRRAGLGQEIDNESIIVEDTCNVVVAVVAYVDMWTEKDVYDYDECEKLKDKVIKALSTDAHPWGGFCIDSGVWYLEKDYDSAPKRRR